MPDTPHISIIMPTCNRPGDVRRALDSLVGVHYPSWDLIVVDQSDDLRTREVVEQYATSLPRVAYRHHRSKGTSRARNVGMAATTGDIMVFLDDDCTVKPDWLTQIVAVFERHPRAAYGLAAVQPPEGIPEWSRVGWTPSVYITEELVVHAKGDMRNRIRLPRLMGMAACMFVRREVTQQVDRFDVHFGGGGRFHTFEDGDFMYRVYRAGFDFVRTPAVVVEHYGMRDFQSGAASRLLRLYHFGAGAWVMKALRLGDLFAIVWLLEHFWRYLRFIDPRGFFSSHRSKGVVRLLEYTRGLVASFTLRVDRQSGMYAARTTRG